MNARFRRMMAGDLEMVLQWRNHPEVLKLSGNEKALTLEEHRRWFFTIPAHRFIFEFNDNPVGVLTLKPTSEWSFYLDMENRTKGLGQLMLSVALIYLREVLDISSITARVKEWNLPSLALHSKMGFNRSGAEKDDIFFTKYL